MADQGREVQSPHSLTNDTPHPRRGEFARQSVQPQPRRQRSAVMEAARRSELARSRANSRCAARSRSAVNGRPVQIILIPVGGSQEPLRRAKPIYPAKRSDQRWPLNQPVPKFTPDPAQLDAIRRQSREVLEQARAQRG